MRSLRASPDSSCRRSTCPENKKCSGRWWCGQSRSYGRSGRGRPQGQAGNGDVAAVAHADEPTAHPPGNGVQVLTRQHLVAQILRIRSEPNTLILNDGASQSTSVTCNGVLVVDQHVLDALGALVRVPCVRSAGTADLLLSRTVYFSGGISGFSQHRVRIRSVANTGMLLFFHLVNRRLKYSPQSWSFA